jgi:hypothetical protein
MPACSLESRYWSPWIETGSFVRAAEALGLSDSGVSRAVSRRVLLAVPRKQFAQHRGLPPSIHMAFISV